MSKNAKVAKIPGSDFAYAIQMDNCVYTLSTAPDNSLDSLLWHSEHPNWECLPTYCDGNQIVSYGPNNRLPVQIRDLMDSNNLAPGILTRQRGLLYGEGPFLRRLKFENGEISKSFDEDHKIQQWLDDWDYRAYIDGVMTDYLYLRGFFDVKYLTRARRIGGAPYIAALEHISAKNARLEWPETRNIADVKHILVGNFEENCFGTGTQKFPLFDPTDPGRHSASASYNHTYSFCRDFYSLPEFWGTLRWIIRGSEVPRIFKYVTDNGFNAAYHVHSPSGYWDKKRDELRRTNPAWTEAKLEKEILAVVDSMLKQLTDVLSGAKNAGKFFHSFDVYDPLTQQVMTWKVEAIDQKIKEFIESQIKISEAASSAITSGMGLHPSLSNIMVDGKLSSGSEMLYAHRLFQMSDTELPTRVILSSINQAIKINFPQTDLQLDFYHPKPMSESEISPKDRVKN